MMPCVQELARFFCYVHAEIQFIHIVDSRRAQRTTAFDEIYAAVTFCN